MKYIGLGNWNKYNIYILISILSELLRDSLSGLNYSNYKKPASILPFRTKVRSHNLLFCFIRLASYLFGGIVLYFIEGRNKTKKIEEINIKKYEIVKDYSLENKSVSMILYLILIGVVFSFHIILETFTDLSNLNFWPIEILYIAIISYWIFKNKIYTHKKVAIGIMILVTIISFIESFFPLTKHKNSENKTELTDKNSYEIAIIKYGAYSIPLYFLANELNHIQRDYCWIKAKYLMDIKSVPPYKIFFSIGTVGIILVIIFISIFTYVPCKIFNNINMKGNSYFDDNTSEPLKLYLEYCFLKKYDENTKTLYLFYDNIILISREYSNTDKNNMLEIFLYIPLLLIFNIVIEISRLMMVRYTDPTNILIYRYFYFFIKKLIQFIINEGDEEYSTYTKFILRELEDLLGIISSLIFNELLELKFCGLDYELKKNIDRRGTEDIIQSFEFDNNEDNDKNDGAEILGINEQEIYE